RREGGEWTAPGSASVSCSSPSAGRAGSARPGRAEQRIESLVLLAFLEQLGRACSGPSWARECTGGLGLGLPRARRGALDWVDALEIRATPVVLGGLRAIARNGSAG